MTTRILVIDDNSVVLAVTKGLLEKAGYSVVVSTQVVGASRHLRDRSVVLLDYFMPGLDGSFALESMRRAARAASIRCRFLLFTNDADVSARAAALGFDGAVARKGDPRELLSALVLAVRALEVE
jgi:CheY-like chemotaxis protein